MARLPKPGGDDGTWGDILNSFLAVEHNPDGTLRRTTDIISAKKKADAAIRSLNGKRPDAAGDIALDAAVLGAEPAGLSEGTRKRLSTEYIPLDPGAKSGDVPTISADGKVTWRPIPVAQGSSTPPGPSIVLLGVGEEVPVPAVNGVLYFRLATPGTPTAVKASTPLPTGFTLSWGIPRSPVPIAGYEVRLNAVTVEDVGNVTSRTLGGLIADTDYVVEVRAYDTSGIYSAWSSPITVHTAMTGQELVVWSSDFSSDTAISDNWSGPGVTYTGGHLNGTWSYYAASGPAGAHSSSVNSAVELTFDAAYTNAFFRGVFLRANVGTTNGIRIGWFGDSNTAVVGGAGAFDAGNVGMNSVAPQPTSWTRERYELVDGVIRIFLDGTLCWTYSGANLTTYDSGNGYMGVCGESQNLARITQISFIDLGS